MSARLRPLSSALYRNATSEDSESRGVVYECKVFNISMLSLSACVLTVLAVSCCVSYLNRLRHRRRTAEYERAVACNLEEEEPVYLKVVQRSRSLHKSLPLFRPPEPFRKDDSNIYYIHTSLLPVGRDDDDAVDPKCTMLTLNDPMMTDGMVLDPPTFYMQL